MQARRRRGFKYLLHFGRSKRVVTDLCRVEGVHNGAAMERVQAAKIRNARTDRGIRSGWQSPQLQFEL